MDAALDLIWRHSYGSTGVDEICRVAGVTKGSFYHFFESKAILAVAVCEMQAQEMREELDGIFSPSVPPLQRLEAFCARAYEHHLEMKTEKGMVCGCPLFTLGSEVGTQEETIRAKVEEMLARMLRYYESTIRDGMAEGVFHVRDAKESAQQVLTYVEGAMTQARIQNNLAPISGIRAAVFRLLGVVEPAAAA